MDNPFLAVALFLIMVVGAFGLFSLIVWWLVMAAFPALAFGYTNAMALTGLLMLLNVPGLLKS